jgi:tetratricopeptide (TPR) repeat protein
MNRIASLALVALTAAGCTLINGDRDRNPYEEPPFYAKYLNTGTQLDAQIQQRLDALRANPNAATLHNELGSLLVQKNFPKDAVVEFERAIDIDGDFYPAWYNLGLVRAALGDEAGARRAFEQTIDLKPGHPTALFQLGLMSEKAGDRAKAVRYYTKAYTHNPRLLDVRVNPRILDSSLTHLAVLQLYGTNQARQSMQFHGAPAGYTDKAPEAPSPEARPKDIVPPATQT